jgi:NitT/TauT family transport system ATP-binding protein
VVFQDANLFPWMTVRDNVRFGLRQQGRPPEQVTSLAREGLELVGMTAQAEAWPISLSGGMRQRVAIARLLALQPRAMLLDEPFSALDANSRERLQDELLAICGRRPCTVLYITHSVEEAAYLAERVIVMGSAPNTIHAEVRLPFNRQRNRGSPPSAETIALLRGRLDELPCCIPASG